MSSKPIKDLIKGDVKLTSGHRLCAGCPEAVIARQVLMATAEARNILRQVWIKA